MTRPGIVVLELCVLVSAGICILVYVGLCATGPLVMLVADVDVIVVDGGRIFLAELISVCFGTV